MSDPILTLRGPRVGLGPVTKDALPLLLRWWNDQKIMLPLSGQLWPSTMKDAETWYDQYAVKGDGSQVHFLAYRLGDVPVLAGHCNLFGINYRNQTAWAGGFIGDKRYWGRDYAVEGAGLLLGFAFHVLGLHNVTASIHADNRGSLRVAEMIGFKEFGRQRGGARRGQQRVDMVFLDITADDLARG